MGYRRWCFDCIPGQAPDGVISMDLSNDGDRARRVLSATMCRRDGVCASVVAIVGKRHRSQSIPRSGFNRPLVLIKHRPTVSEGVGVPEAAQAVLPIVSEGFGSAGGPQKVGPERRVIGFKGRTTTENVCLMVLF